MVQKIKLAQHVLVFFACLAYPEIAANNCPVAICLGDRLKTISKLTEAFFLVPPEADRRSAEGGTQKKAEVNFEIV